jgi:uroporphyrinogen decarboxylase
LFGCEIRFEQHDIPTVIGRRVTSLEEILALPHPVVNSGRALVNLDAAEMLVKKAASTPVLSTPLLSTPVLGGLIGPFSLAGRIFGVSEALESTALQPELVHALLERVTAFQIEYAAAFRARGAAGVVMAEPLAGLLSPRALGLFSAPYVRQIIDAVQTEDFAVLLHNCGARLAHLQQILKSGAEIYHFGAPMDIVGALQQVDGQVVLCGNLDPTAVFHSGTLDEVTQKTRLLFEQTRPYSNFVLSSGCDIPPGTPAENIKAFFEVVGESQP